MKWLFILETTLYEGLDCDIKHEGDRETYLKTVIRTFKILSNNKFIKHGKIQSYSLSKRTFYSTMDSVPLCCKQTQVFSFI